MYVNGLMNPIKIWSERRKTSCNLLMKFYQVHVERLSECLAVKRSSRRVSYSEALDKVKKTIYLWI